MAWDCLLPEDSKGIEGQLHPAGSNRLLFGKRVFTRVLLAMLLPVMFLLLWLCIWVGRCVLVTSASLQLLLAAGACAHHLRQNTADAVYALECPPMPSCLSRSVLQAVRTT